MGLILAVVLIVLLIGGLPQLGLAPTSYGYYPSGLLGIVLIVVLILFLMGRI